MAYDLEDITEVVRVLNLVEERKRQGRIYNTMASVVAQKLGRSISGGENIKIKNPFFGNRNLWNNSLF